MDQHQTSAQAGNDPLDETGLCLLSVDGGGVRGLSTLLILKVLTDRGNAERRAQKQASVKSSDLFDLAGGLSAQPLSFSAASLGSGYTCVREILPDILLTEPSTSS